MLTAWKGCIPVRIHTNTTCACMRDCVQPRPPWGAWPLSHDPSSTLITYRSDQALIFVPQSPLWPLFRQSICLIKRNWILKPNQTGSVKMTACAIIGSWNFYQGSCFGASVCGLICNKNNSALVNSLWCAHGLAFQSCCLGKIWRRMLCVGVYVDDPGGKSVLRGRGF